MLKSATLFETWRVHLDAREDKTWEAVVREITPGYSRIVFRVSARWGVTQWPLIEDALQEALLKLSIQRAKLEAQLADASPEGLAGYFSAIAANAARDYWKSQRVRLPSPPLREPDQNLEVLVEPDSTASASDRRLLIEQIGGLLPVNNRDRSVFWFYYRYGFSAREIAGLPALGLTVKGVESVIQRLTTEVRNRLRGPDRSRPKGFARFSRYRR